jgi:uncharacterized protein (DUF3084 family)
MQLVSEKREARSEKREARSEKREARSEKREARSEKRIIWQNEYANTKMVSTLADHFPQTFSKLII